MIGITIFLLLIALLIPSSVTSWSLNSVSRRDVARILLGQSSWLLSAPPAPATDPAKQITLQQDDIVTTNKVAPSLQKYPYNKEWTGTSLKRLTQSAAANYPSDAYPMGQWPDPILRISASQVGIMDDTFSSSSSWNSNELKRIATKLTQTARTKGAVGLAAQQCGIDVSMVFLDHVKGNGSGIVMINPRIIDRSSELKMKVWTEQCLVLPPSFTATLLRDASIRVQYQDIEGMAQYIDLDGELARAAQHEMDHDGGILIVDHVSLEELESEDMRRIERLGHENRMEVAYARSTEGTSTASRDNSRIALRSSDDAMEEEMPFGQRVKEWMVPVARADEQGSTAAATTTSQVAPSCDESCLAARQRILENRRQLMRQSRSNTQRSDVLELSRQRAALYNTTYQGVTCPPGIPCL